MDAIFRTPTVDTAKTAGRHNRKITACINNVDLF